MKGPVKGGVKTKKGLKNRRNKTRKAGILSTTLTLQGGEKKKTLTKRTRPEQNIRHKRRIWCVGSGTNLAKFGGENPCGSFSRVDR